MSDAPAKTAQATPEAAQAPTQVPAQASTPAEPAKTQQQEAPKEAVATVLGGAKEAPKTEGTTNTEAKGETAKEPAKAASDDLELKLPEGVEQDAELMAGFKAIAKEHGIPKEVAQKIATLQGTATLKAVKAQETAIREAHAAQVKSWADALKADKELGGSNYEATVVTAQKAVLRFAPELRDFLNQTGLGNHPDFVRAFARVGKAISEDSVAGTSGNSRSGPRTRDEVLAAYYDKSNREKE